MTSPGNASRLARRARLSRLRAYLFEPFADGADQTVHRAFALASTMTLLMTLLRAPAESSIFMVALVIAGVLAPRYTRDTRWFWIVLILLFLISPLQRPWLALDNHHFLHVYWLSAIAVTRFATLPNQALQTVARLLIGLAFAFAVTWKLLAPEFLDGSFFEFTFGTDSRLAGVASALGVQDEGLLETNRALIDSWRDAESEPAAGALGVSGSLGTVSIVLAWLTVVIEGAVALLFLTPLRGRWRLLRDAALILFVAATYPLAPVLGFGWLLLSIGAMQSTLSERMRYLVYVTAFVGVALLEERDRVLEWIGTTGIGDFIRSIGSAFL